MLGPTGPAGDVLVGWSSVDITPPLPCAMGGYAARLGPATTIHDPLLAQALALGTPAQLLVMIVCDLVSVNQAIVAGVRERLCAHSPHAIVWVGATHTHAGPAVGGVLAQETTAPGIEAVVVNGAVRAAQTAIRAMQPGSARWARGWVAGLAGNRAHPEVDTRLALDLLVLSRGAQPAAVFGSFPCHPTVLGPANHALSADLPGAFRQHLRAGLGESIWVALATGAAGNISTRHTRQAQTFDEVQRLGSRLADHALRLVSGARPIRLGPPEVRSVRMDLRPRDHQTVRAEVAAARAGDLALVALPGELYDALGEHLRREFDALLVLGYTNGYIGYVPTREGFGADLDYEVLMSRVAPGEGERLVDVAAGLIPAVQKG